ncbi:MAG: hypothetical protein KUG77_29385 [Nannocystaceae bacterium]|nr:hypothetical protein [Nannocystaceae bacterium]
MPDDPLELSGSDGLLDDEDVKDGAVEEVTSEPVLVEASSPVLVASTLCDGEVPQAVLTSRKMAAAARTFAQAITRPAGSDLNSSYNECGRSGAGAAEP